MVVDRGGGGIPGVSARNCICRRHVSDRVRPGRYGGGGDGNGSRFIGGSTNGRRRGRIRTVMSDVEPEC